MSNLLERRAALAPVMLPVLVCAVWMMTASSVSAGPPSLFALGSPESQDALSFDPFRLITLGKAWKQADTSNRLSVQGVTGPKTPVGQSNGGIPSPAGLTLPAPAAAPVVMESAVVTGSPSGLESLSAVAPATTAGLSYYPPYVPPIRIPYRPPLRSPARPPLF
jgi:hypothetical protein